MQVITRARTQSAHVTQRCHNSLRWWNGWQTADDVMHRKRAEDLVDFEEKLRELKAWHRTRRFDFWGSLRRDELARHGCCTRYGPDEEASIKWLGLSSYVVTFNSRVIKRFRTWTKKSLRVFEFWDSYVLYAYMLPTFDVHFVNSRIWLCNKCPWKCFQNLGNGKVENRRRIEIIHT